MKTISILGDGAWGTAFAQLLACNGYEVIIWCYNKHVAHSIQTHQENLVYLPDIKLSPLIRPTLSLEYAFAHADWIFEAIPVKFLRSLLTQSLPFLKAPHRLVFLSKGIEQDSLLLPTQIATQVIGSSSPFLVLSGPSFARDLALKQPTAVDVGCSEKELARDLQTIIHTSYFTTHFTYDIIGMQVSGALKNIIALAVGILNGAGYTDNTKAIVAMQGLQELAFLVDYLGGKKETAWGLAGVGDLVLTAYSTRSKNFSLGVLIAQGKTIEDLSRSLIPLPESINTLGSVYQFMQKHKLRLPLFLMLYEIIFNHQPIPTLLTSLGFSAN